MNQHCSFCGKQMKVIEEDIIYYDSQDGTPVYRAFLTCPDYGPVRYCFFWFIGNGHSCEGGITNKGRFSIPYDPR